MATPAARAVLKRPNVLVTGTPGTGKTTTAAAIAVQYFGWSGGSVSSRLHYTQIGLGCVCGCVSGRTRPNVHIPTYKHTNKRTHHYIQEATGLRHLNVGELVREVF